MTLKDLGENGLIDRIRQRFKTAGAVVGIGDDAAVIDPPAGRSIVYCSDLVAEGTHFLRDRHPADSVGYKAVAVNVSDVGAMGGVASHFLISFAAPPDLDVSWIDGFLDGVERACADFSVSLAGGDSSSAERIFVDVSMIGFVAKGAAVLRSGARPGDLIYVTGQLGGSALGLERLLAGDRKHPSVQRHLYPTPRQRVGAAVAAQAHAMIDVSDGLSTDLGHILRESEVRGRIDRHRIPKAPETSDERALHGGEEYELIIVAPSLPASIDGVSITAIGEIVAPDPDGNLYLKDGSHELRIEPHGFQHF